MIALTEYSVPPNGYAKIDAGTTHRATASIRNISGLFFIAKCAYNAVKGAHCRRKEYSLDNPSCSASLNASSRQDYLRRRRRRRRRIEEHDEEDGEEPLDVCFPPTPSFSSPSPWPFGYRKCYNTPRIDMSVFLARIQAGPVQSKTCQKIGFGVRNQSRIPSPHPNWMRTRAGVWRSRRPRRPKSPHPRGVKCT